MLHIAARTRHTNGRPYATRRHRRDQSLAAAAPVPRPAATVTPPDEPPAIRRGSFREHALQFPELYQTPEVPPPLS